MTQNKCSRWLAEGHQHVHITTLCEILGDKIAYNTLLSVIDKPKSVADVCIEQRTPLSSTYRAMKKLQEAGLVSVKSYANINTRRLAVYSSRVKSIHIDIDKDGGRLKMVEVK